MSIDFLPMADQAALAQLREEATADRFACLVRRANYPRLVSRRERTGGRWEGLFLRRFLGKLPYETPHPYLNHRSSHS